MTWADRWANVWAVSALAIFRDGLQLSAVLLQLAGRAGKTRSLRLRSAYRHSLIAFTGSNDGPEERNGENPTKYPVTLLRLL